MAESPPLEWYEEREEAISRLLSTGLYLMRAWGNGTGYTNDNVWHLVKVDKVRTVCGVPLRGAKAAKSDSLVGQVCGKCLRSKLVSAELKRGRDGTQS